MNLHYHLRVELGPSGQVSNERLAQLNELLAEVSEKLRLERR